MFPITTTYDQDLVRSVALAWQAALNVLHIRHALVAFLRLITWKMENVLHAPRFQIVQNAIQLHSVANVYRIAISQMKGFVHLLTLNH